nr:MmcQ/YjbR family DNA-binding protein [uncultured Caproiciproducens sp.]
MLTKRQLIDYCLTFPRAYEDYPFDEDSGSADAWAVMRHRVNQKSFAFIFERGGHLNINLKCDPMYADLLRGVYPGVIPAYHMNKVHWNTVIIDGAIPDGEVFSWIGQSYGLIKPKSKKI